MFKWSPFPFVRYTFFLILGILAYQQFPGLWEQGRAWGLLAFSGLLALTLGKFSHTDLIRVTSGLLGLFVIFWAGGYRSYLLNELNQATHYSHQKDIKGFEGVVISGVTESKNHNRYELDIKYVLVDDKVTTATGKIHLYLKKGDKQQIVSYGDHVMIRSGLVPLQKPKNPGEFDYQNYLHNQNIYGQVFADIGELAVVGRETPNELLALAQSLRESAKDRLFRYIDGDEERQIAMALLIGVKEYLSKEIKSIYASAGATHILAVSGLHVGILYLIITSLLGRLRGRKWGRVIFVGLTLLSIWLYTLVTGMTPSVLRAATMFSVISITQLRPRKANIYNSLGLSAFILLLYNPNFIYTVGFQLSFVAVAGIVYLYPKLYEALEVGWKPLDQVWRITCVSIAAQVATFPLTIYYFHQFPSYFLLSNLFVIPGAYIILVFGLPMLVVGALLEFIGEFVGFWLNQVISILNAIVAFIDQLPGSVINWLYFDHIETVLIYLIIILFLITFHYRSRSAFILFCGLFITINFWQLHLIYDHHHRQQMVVYHTEEALAIDLIRGNNVELLSNAEKTDAEEIEANVNPFRLSSGLPSVDMEERQKKWKSIGPFHLITWSDRKILVLDQELEGFTFTTPMTCDILILSGNAVKSLATLPDQIEFDQLIIAGDNHWWVAKKLKREARELKLPVHSIKEDGYWMLDLG